MTPSLVVGIAANFLNVALNYLFIFKMGLRFHGTHGQPTTHTTESHLVGLTCCLHCFAGAPLATSACRIFLCVGLFLYAWWRGLFTKSRRGWARCSVWCRWSGFKDYLKLAPSSLALVCLVTSSPTTTATT